MKKSSYHRNITQFDKKHGNSSILNLITKSIEVAANHKLLTGVVVLSGALHIGLNHIDLDQSREQLHHSQSAHEAKGFFERVTSQLKVEHEVANEIFANKPETPEVQKRSTIDRLLLPPER